MSNIFDQLHNIIGNQDEGGLSVLDLQELPEPLLKLMRVMLREVTMTYEEMTETMRSMPEDSRLEGAELDEALDELTKLFWLIKRGDEGEQISYKVNLRAKPGSTLGAGIWAALDDKVDPSQQPDSADEADV